MNSRFVYWLLLIVIVGLIMASSYHLMDWPPQIKNDPTIVNELFDMKGEEFG